MQDGWGESRERAFTNMEAGDSTNKLQVQTDSQELLGSFLRGFYIASDMAHTITVTRILTKQRH